MPAPAVSAAATARAASSPVATGRPGALSSVTSASSLVPSRDTTGSRRTPAAAASTAYRRSGTPSPGTRSTSAASAPATPRTVPVSLATPEPSRSSGCPIRTGQGPRARVTAPSGAGGMDAKPTASAAVRRPAASSASSSSPLPSSAVVATTALVR